MQGLFGKITGDSKVNEELIQEYFRRNECKKEDEKWIKENRLLVIEELKRLDRDAVDYGNIRVSMAIPDTSKFDKNKVLKFTEKLGIRSEVVKEELDEDKLVQLIESGKINIEELKEYAWIESSGSPRITVREISK